MTDQPELLPCPFCGGKAEYECGGVGEGKHWVRCASDKCSVRPTFHDYLRYANKEAMISAWNERQACGQQPVVPEPGLIQDVYTFVEAALKVGDHSKELDFIRHLLGYIEWQKRTSGPVAGYKLVPIEPTQEMMDAMNSYAQLRECYRAAPPAMVRRYSSTWRRGLTWQIDSWLHTADINTAYGKQPRSFAFFGMTALAQIV